MKESRNCITSTLRCVFWTFKIGFHPTRKWVPQLDKVPWKLRQIKNSSKGTLLYAQKCNFHIACVAGAKRGGGGGREKGKREGSACSKSLCFCITPTNFLVIRLRLLSIKCRYTRHCRKTLHPRTKEICLVIQIQKALWRKLEPSFSRNKKSFTLQKRSKKLRLHQSANPADQKTITTVNRYVCHDLSTWNMRLK